jgi:carboxymethylenebutenolidase
MKKITVTIPVSQRDMALYTACPSGDGPFPAIVVIQHAGGVDTFVQEMVSRLVDAGYFVVAPDLFHRLDPRQGGMMDKLKQLRDNELEQDVQATVDYLRGHPQVDEARLGIIGFCMGGRVAYLMAELIPTFRAVVTYYGGNIMVPWGEGPAPFDLSNQLHCPLLFHFGANDTNPSPADQEKLEQELTRLGKEHQFYTYPDAGHAFMNFANAERYRETAAETSWPRTLEFFAHYLT